MSVAEKKNCFVVTGVSALIGQGIVSSLKFKDDVAIIGVDKKYSEYARKICSIFIQKPNTPENTMEYLDFWAKLIKDFEISLIFPGISHDINFFCKNYEFFKKHKCKIILNNTELIRLCNDKLQIHQKLTAQGVETIPSSIEKNWSGIKNILGRPPYLIKPRNGEGSQGIYFIKDQADLNYWTTKKRSNFILQKIIGDDENEFTVGTFGLGQGNLLDDMIIMRRRLSREGNTVFAEIVDCQSIEIEVRKLAKILHPIGPTNFQFRLYNGHPYLLEVNPRFSSSTSLRASFGYNEAEMAVSYYLHGLKPKNIEIKKGTIERQWMDIRWEE